MIIQCKSCSRKFIVKDNDIPKKGRPFQNPASPVLMLQAKPITNIPTRDMPIKIVIFSLNFIF